MDIYRRYRLGLWGFIVLVVLNVGLLGLLWYDRAPRQERPGPHAGPQHPPDDFLIQDLGFDDTQAEAFRNLRRAHIRKTDSLRREIFELNRRMMDEAFADSLDTGKMHDLSSEIGRLHAEFEEEVMMHFRAVGENCSPEQRKKLRRLVHDVLGRAKLPPGRPKGGPPPGR